MVISEAEFRPKRGKEKKKEKVTEEIKIK